MHFDVSIVIDGDLLHRTISQPCEAPAHFLASRKLPASRVDRENDVRLGRKYFRIEISEAIVATPQLRPIAILALKKLHGWIRRAI
jgi:hypothetical protein